jgi:hypothetical protein
MHVCSTASRYLGRDVRALRDRRVARGESSQRSRKAEVGELDLAIDG